MKLFEITDLESDLRRVLLELTAVSPWTFKKDRFKESGKEHYVAESPGLEEYLMVKTDPSRYKDGTVIVRLRFDPMSSWPITVEDLLLKGKKWEVVHTNLEDRHTTKKYLLDDYHLKLK